MSGEQNNDEVRVGKLFESLRPHVGMIEGYCLCMLSQRPWKLLPLFFCRKANIYHSPFSERFGGDTTNMSVSI